MSTSSSSLPLPSPPHTTPMDAPNIRTDDVDRWVTVSANVGRNSGTALRTGFEVSMEGRMNELKAKWEKQQPPVKYGIVAATLAVGLLFVLKILPALIAAMGIGVFLAILIVPYWLPTIIAFRRKHPSKGGVLAVNLLLGWTFVGWVVSLAWALSDNSSNGAPTVVVNTTVSPNIQAGPGAPTTSPHYEVGDVVNGHRFNGAALIPLQAAPPANNPPEAIRGAVEAPSQSRAQ